MLYRHSTALQINTHIYSSTPAHVHIHSNTHTHTCMYTHKLTHTHAHTHHHHQQQHTICRWYDQCSYIQDFAKWFSQTSFDSRLMRLISKLWTHFWQLALVWLVDSHAWRHTPVVATPYDLPFKISRVAICTTCSATRVFKVRSMLKGESWVKWRSRQPFCKTRYIYHAPAKSGEQPCPCASCIWFLHSTPACAQMVSSLYKLALCWYISFH